MECDGNNESNMLTQNHICPMDEIMARGLLCQCSATELQIQPAATPQ